MSNTNMALQGSQSTMPEAATLAPQSLPGSYAREIAAPDTADIRVLTLAGTPIAQACVLRGMISIVPGWAECCSLAIASTDANGKATVPVGEDMMTVSVHAELYIPGRIHSLMPGHKYEIVLQPALRTTIRVHDRRGKAVAGFGVGVPMGLLGREELASGSSSPANGPYSLTENALVSRAITDQDGIATLLLPPGDYRPTLNSTDLPLVVVNSRDVRRLNAGGTHDIVVSELVALVIKLENDEVLGHLVAPGSGARFLGDHDNSRVRAQAQEELRRRFPECVVSCEATRETPGDAELFVVGRHSGLTKHRVSYKWASQWEQPHVLVLPTSTAPLSGQLVINIRNPDGSLLQLEAGEVMFRAKHGGSWIAIDLPGSGQVEVPAGQIQVLPGTTGIPATAFQVTDVEVRAGQVSTIDIQLRRALFRGRLSFVRSNGDAPLRGSVDYGVEGAMRTRLMSANAQIAGWFEEGSQYSASFAGERAAGLVNIDKTVDPNKVQEWKVEVVR